MESPLIVPWPWAVTVPYRSPPTLIVLIAPASTVPLLPTVPAER